MRAPRATTPGVSVPRGRRAALGVVAVIATLAIAGWVAAQQIRSPAQIAADAAPPAPSAITVPVESRTMLEDFVSGLLEPLFPVNKGIRLLGVTLTSLQADSEPRIGQQLRLPL